MKFTIYNAYCVKSKDEKSGFYFLYGEQLNLKTSFNEQLKG
jgi:hypothetical protein